MTTISRILELHTPANVAWQYMDVRKWPEISEIFRTVTLSTRELQQGAEAEIIAGPGQEKVNYTAKITACEPGNLLEYERSGGPLPGKSTWKIVPNGNGCRLEYTNTYQHDLPAPVKDALAHAMDRFLQDLKSAVEAGSH